MSPRPQSAQPVLLIVMSVLITVVCLLCLEGILRCDGRFQTFSERDRGFYVSYYGQVHDSWLWVHRENSTFPYPNAEFDYEVRTNNEGIRDIDHPVRKPEGCFRVVVLGDSTTEGLGSPFAQIWWKVLENLLREKGYNIEFISGGVSGNDLFFSYQLLRQKLLKYSPDLVIVALNESDIADYVYRGGMERFRRDGTSHFRTGPWYEPFYEYSHFVRFVIHTILDYDWRFHSNKRRDDVNREALDQILSALDEFKDLSTESNFSLCVLTHPTGTELLANYSGFTDEFLEQVDTRSITHLNLGPVVRESITDKNKSDLIWPVNQHLNGDGNVLFATLVLPALKNSGLLPPLSP